ncbi:WD repeat and FYVE domain-containing protein 3 [Nilaparvata lugens]|uniref:WD repeat and FYVE domain-containing protein 3 n=1 Tax=Nilaparvata lugens TaxID=108931 RepID=UPI00193E21D9|nr:WD repeat and FYVE domain-containing protein 3 [Nilaparvata lugens]
MATLLGMMHSAPSSSLTLKGHILYSLLVCLRESHRARTVFRKVGGFVYVMSVLVSMEGCLMSGTPQPPWDSISLSQILGLLHTVFNTITVAMRFEPGNARFFHQEICSTSLCDTLRLLGCFSPLTKLEENEEVVTSAREENTFHNLFTGNVLEPSLPEHIPTELSYACLVLRMLYDVALDSYDKPNSSTVVSFKSPSHKRNMETQKSLESPCSGRRVNTLNLTPPVPDPIVVHPGVVIAILHLLPSIQHSSQTQLTLTLQLYAAEVVKSLVRCERNQQLMCEVGLPGQLLAVGEVPLEDETHPLHPPLQYMLERLATQSLEPKDLREFLRLGSPLCCQAMDSILHHPSRRPGGSVPLTRVKTLVSMTTPRSQTNIPLPPFVEMDMSAEGFGCMYLPSVAPQSVVFDTLTAPDLGVVGGMGSGDRIFPPQTGLSFSSWICVERFSDPRTDPHCVRLLTLVRNLHSAKDDHLICLAVVLSARDKAVIVTTQETPLSHTGADWEPDVQGSSVSCARIWCPDLLQEGTWHHLVLVLNRAVLKNSSFSLYMDGQHVHSQKLHYISQNPGGGAANLTVASSVYGFIGTPPIWRRNSRLIWKQGPCHLLEEVLSPHIVTTIYQLGPNYIGSLQAPQLNFMEVLPPLVTEEKVVFGLNAKAVTQVTLSKIRKIYSRADNKSIAKQFSGLHFHVVGEGVVRLRSQRQERVYDRENYIDFRLRLLGEPGQGPVLLSPGIHSFPFKLGLPLGLPSTFLGKHGWVQYFCKAALREPNGLTHKNQQVFIVMNPIDLNLEPTILAQPFRCEIEHKLGVSCVNSGPVVCRVSLDRGGYVPGETIGITAVVSNQSKVTIKATKAALTETIQYKARGKVLQSETRELASLSRGKIRPGETDEWTNEQLYVPPLPPTNLRGCHLIKIQYDVYFIIDPKSFEKEVKLQLPIMMATYPLRGTEGTLRRKQGTHYPSTLPIFRPWLEEKTFQ